MSRLLRLTRHRTLTLPSIHRTASSFSRPSPPKLSAKEQSEFERLQRDAAVSSAFQPPQPTTEQSISSSSSAAAAAIETKTDEEVNQGIFRGAKPEFKGDVNPKTGEVGGPKNEPLRWGGTGDWSYNGRATDF